MTFLDPDRWPVGRQKMFQANFLVAHLAVALWCVSAFTWTGFALGLLAYLLFGKIGGDIGFHRYFSHRSFKTSPFVEWVMLVLGTLSGFGSSISWVAMHGIHHAKVDTQSDPHSPGRVGFWRCYFYLYDYSFRMTDAASTKFLRDAVRDKRQLFIHRHYFKLYYGWLLTLAALSVAFFSWLPLIGFWAWPVVWIFHGSGASNSICHRYGYQNFTGPVAGKSTNNTWLNLILLGNALHNNHHGKPRSHTFDTEGKWYEFDVWGLLIRHVLAKK
jgi:stearoyl-CoA desaturase (delta-9 desaturase)